ncbi:MAG: protein kinase [Planctomycetota bacterium]
MKDQLGRFHLTKQVNPGGLTTVYLADEDMGRGLTRPAAVKILTGWNMDSEEDVEQLNKEVSILLELSANANIVSIRHFDIDEGIGPYIAMELLGRSLHHEIGETPADPAHVRSVLADILGGLKAMHDLEPAVVHRDIKPNNLLPDASGLYKIADFGLATRFDEGDTLTRVTVKYAAPELLDNSFGKVCPASDLYALGMTVYELALGSSLFRKQFPGIYDPHATRDEQLADDRPKWMYWHCSLEQTVPPVKELVEGFPDELSDVIEEMMKKPLADRMSSADEAIERLARMAVVRKSYSTGGPAAHHPEKSSSGDSTRTLLLAAALIVVVVIAGLAFMVTQSGGPEIDGGLYWPDEQAQADRLIRSQSDRIQIRGWVEGPAERVTVTAQGVSPVTASVDSEGSFIAMIPISARFVGQEVVAQLKVIGEDDSEETKSFTILREPPESVKLNIVTTPRVPGAEVEALPRDSASAPVVAVRTSDNGTAEITMPYGQFDLMVRHPRYRVFSETRETGAEASRQVRVQLMEATAEEIADRRTQLLAEIDRVAALAAAGDPEAAARLKELQGELASLGDTSLNADRRAEILSEMAALAEAAANGDPEAQRKLRALKAELAALDDDAALADRRAEILREMDELAQRAANGDPEAIARMRELQQELAAIDATTLEGQHGEAAQRIARERAAIMAEMADLAERAANGDPEAIARLAVLRDRLAALDAEEAALASGSDAEKARNAKAIQLASSRERLISTLREQIAAAQSGSSGAYDALDITLVQLEALESSDDNAEGIMAELVQHRRGLLSELRDAIDRGRLGEPYAVATMRGIQIRLSDLVLDERAIAQGRQRVGLTLMDKRRGELMAGILSDLTQIADASQAAVTSYITKAREFEALGSDSSPNAPRRTQLMREAEQISPQAVVGDTIAQTRVRQIRDELGQIEQREAIRRNELAQRGGGGGYGFTPGGGAGGAQASAGGGGAGGSGGFGGGASGGFGGSGGGFGGAAPVGGGDGAYFDGSASDLVALLPNLDLIDRTVLLRLPQSQFLAYIERQLPIDSLMVEDIPELKKARLRGRVLNREEFDRLIGRIEPALLRLEPEIAIDTDGVLADIRGALEARGAENVRVSILRQNSRDRLFVRFDRAGEVKSDGEASSIVSRFLLDEQLMDVQGFGEVAEADDEETTS